MDWLLDTTEAIFKFIFGLAREATLRDESRTALVQLRPGNLLLRAPGDVRSLSFYFLEGDDNRCRCVHHFLDGRGRDRSGRYRGSVRGE